MGLWYNSDPSGDCFLSHCRTPCPASHSWSPGLRVEESGSREPLYARPRRGDPPPRKCDPGRSWFPGVFPYCHLHHLRAYHSLPGLLRKTSWATSRSRWQLPAPPTSGLADPPPSSSFRTRSPTMSTVLPASEEPTCSPAAPARGPTTSAAWTRPSRQHPRACGCAPSASRRYGRLCRPPSPPTHTTSEAAQTCVSWVPVVGAGGVRFLSLGTVDDAIDTLGWIIHCGGLPCSIVGF